MLKIATAAQMRRIDDAAIRERGIAGIELMERAGRAVAREALERFAADSAAIVCGKGNNGGDGFVAARHLHQAGIPVGVFALFDPAEARGDAALALGRLAKECPEVAVKRIEGEDEGKFEGDGGATLAKFIDEIREYDLIIDAIFGTGLAGPATGLPARAIEALNAAGPPILAVDIPSGLEAGARQSGGPHVRAAVTVSIGLPKIGVVVDPGMRAAGVVTVEDIGFPRDLLEDPAITASLMGLADAAALLPARPAWGHKGTFGKALIVAGSEGMTGAAVLAARAASRSGCGLVYSAYPAPLGAIMESRLVEPVKRPLAGEARWLAPGHLEAALAEADTADAIAFGPGIGQRAETAAFAAEFIRRAQSPLVIDADGLNTLAGDLALIRERAVATILTPHPGEAARLLKTSTAEIEADRFAAAERIAKESGAVVVLKGSQTLVADPAGAIFVNPTGNSGLAKGGSGDVLTGLIVGLLAQGAAPLAAAQLGVFLHGLAADRAAAKIGVRAMIASDVIDFLGESFMQLERRDLA